MKISILGSIAKAACGVLLVSASSLSAQVFSGLGDPLPGGDGTSAADISANGRVIAANNLSDTAFPGPQIEALRWRMSTGLVGLGVPPGSVTSKAEHISPDGRVITGRYYFPVSSGGDPNAFGSQAYRWTPRGGMVPLPLLPGGTTSSVAGLSTHGAVLAGSGDSSAGFQAFRWTAAAGTVGLGILPGETYSQSDGISANGAVIVGESGSEGMIEGFRWTQSDGMVGIGFLPGSTENDRLRVSADGQVIVGTGVTGQSPNFVFQAFRWTQDGGITGLGFLPGDTDSEADLVSADGSVVVGHGKPGVFSSSPFQAFRWTEADGMVGLGYLPGGGSYSYAESMVPDGSIIVGTSDSADGLQAFLWTSQSGMRSTQDILTNDYGADLTGWTLVTAMISADGSTLTGEGINPSGQKEAWVAHLNL
ncbi:MAG TPA: hypothetical protein VFB27_04585 [Opitutaceae bacterium]|nr:hypothetical protein [Opitutaceae bacterium]